MNGQRTIATLLIALVAMTALGGASVQAAEATTTVAEDALAGWLTAIRSQDETAVREHFEANFADSFRSQLPVERYEAMTKQLRPSFTGIEADPLITDGEYGLSGWYKIPQGVWLELLLNVEPEPPHKIIGLLLRQGTPPDSEQPPLPANGTLQEMIDHALSITGIPGMAAAHVVDGETKQIAVAGLRMSGGEAPIEADDLFHLGSVTKPMTSTMLARLIERGVLDWGTTIGEVLDDVEMLPIYRDVTLRQLMQHRAGVIPATSFDEEALKRWAGLEGTPTEQRGAFVGYTLNQPPVAEIDSASTYSNAGYGLAAYMAERVTGKSWDALMRKELFKPAKLKSAGFGWPLTPERGDQPSGHYKIEDGFRPQEVGEYTLGEFLAPAGDTHMTISDLAKFAIVHLRGLRGEDGILKSETIQRLHIAPKGDDYACGWVIAKAPSGMPAHWHNGTVGTFYALLILIPEANEAFAFAFNAAPGAEEAARNIAMAMHSRGPKAD